MIQALITWKAKDIKSSSIINGQFNSVFKLNNEWIIVCLWSGELGLSLKPHSISFRRVSTTDAVSISGIIVSKTIVHNTYVEIEPTIHFQRIMESGSSSLMVNLDRFTLEVFTERHKMCFSVGITSVGTSANEECRNCVHLERLSNDLARLKSEPDSYFPDVNLKCGNASIPAHKNILSARCPVFASMFQNPMRENLENEVVITDMEESVLRLMLSYIYEGQVSDLTVSLASGLLFAADEYQLEDLKEVCYEFLNDNISLQNVLKIALIGDLFCRDLKSSAIHYICNSCTDISVLEITEEWETMKLRRPYLIIDILTSVVKAKEKSEKLNKEVEQSLSR